MGNFFTKRICNNRFICKSTATMLLSVLLLSQAQAQIVYGVTSAENLVCFNVASPGVLTSSKPITGITSGQSIEGLDFRPNTGQLYAFGYNSTSATYQVYTIDRATAVATALNVSSNIALGNGPIGFDFNPTVDRIRLVSANGASYRLHPVTGLIVATDLNLAYAGTDVNAGAIPKVVAAAYTNSYIGTAATALYDYDLSLNTIALQNPPNNGTLNTVGVSGLSVDSNSPFVDMDIFYNDTIAENKAYLTASTISSGHNLYTLNLSTGAATLVGGFPDTVKIKNISVHIDRTLPAIMGQLAFGLSGTNLISFDTQKPSVLRSLIAITGLTSGQTIVGMDFRPANNMLYALGYNATNNEAQLYTINTNTGAATAVNASAITLVLGSSSVGVDFNPVVDRIRVVSNNDMNHRLDPNTGALVATDQNINFAVGDVNTGANPSAGTVAYTNSYAGTTTTTLYNLDEVLGVLTTQIPPNNGTLNTIGTTGIALNAADPSADLDIFYEATTMINTAYLSANIDNETIDRLYTVNLATGLTSLIGKIGFGVPVRDIAIQTTGPVTATTDENIEMGMSLVNIYPSVLSETATITIQGAYAEFYIYDIKGQKIQPIYSAEVSGTTQIIHWNTAGLAKGMYMVNVVNLEGRKQSVRVIK